MTIDVRSMAFTDLKGATGATGATGPSGGPTGPTGPTGAFAFNPSYGEVYVTGNTTPTTLTTQNTWYPIEGWDTAGPTSGMTVNTSGGIITVGNAGVYKVSVLLSGEGDSGSPRYEFTMFHNGMEHSAAPTQLDLNTGNVSTIGLHCIHDLEAGDYLEVKVRCISNTNKTFTQLNGSFLMFAIA